MVSLTRETACDLIDGCGHTLYDVFNTTRGKIMKIPPRKSLSTRFIAITLVLALISVMASPPPAQAMLAPARLAQSSPAVDRSADLQTIQKTLESKVLVGRLHALGLSDAEIQSRLSRLSDAQRHQLASQIRAVNPAGDLLIGILVLVVLVLLIIFLIKRI
jgi:hypothetical protein